MNKKNILNLNIIEVSSFILSLLFMGIYLMPTNVILVKPLLFLLGSVCGLTFISIELFLILVMSNKYRVIYISCLLKGLFKVLLSDKIYVGSRYSKYSKLFTTEYNEIKNNISKLFNKKKVLVPVTSKKKVRNKGLQKDLV